MDFKDIIYRKENEVARIIINRPEKRNALNRAARLEMMEALGDAENDIALKVLILSGGRGEKFYGRI